VGGPRSERAVKNAAQLTWRAGSSGIDCSVPRGKPEIFTTLQNSKLTALTASTRVKVIFDFSELADKGEILK
jgi:hypothetical protein